MVSSIIENVYNWNYILVFNLAALQIYELEEVAVYCISYFYHRIAKFVYYFKIELIFLYQAESCYVYFVVSFNQLSAVTDFNLKRV